MPKLYGGRTHCRKCGRPFRSGKEKTKDRPGTVVHGANGLCKNDYDKQRKVELPKDGSHRSSQEETKKNLENFLSQIHAQGQKDRRRARQHMVIK